MRNHDKTSERRSTVRKHSVTLIIAVVVVMALITGCSSGSGSGGAGKSVDEQFIASVAKRSGISLGGVQGEG